MGLKGSQKNLSATPGQPTRSGIRHVSQASSPPRAAVVAEFAGEQPGRGLKIEFACNGTY